MLCPRWLVSRAAACDLVLARPRARSGGRRSTGGETCAAVQSAVLDGGAVVGLKGEKHTLVYAGLTENTGRAWGWPRQLAAEKRQLSGGGGRWSG
jgi:hypothetical protein